MSTVEKMSSKKFSELMVVEKYLPHLNSKQKKSYRVDYNHLLKRDENSFPDIMIFDLSNPNDRIEIEVTKAPNLKEIEEREGLEGKFIEGIIKILNVSTIEDRHINADVSISLDRLQLKGNVSKELKLFEKFYPKLYLDTMLVEHRPKEALSGMGFKIIQSITIKDCVFSSLSHGWSEVASLDPFERLITAISKKEIKIADPSKTILLITMDCDINDYYFDAIASHFKEISISFKEIVIAENHKYGKIFFINND